MSWTSQARAGSPSREPQRGEGVRIDGGQRVANGCGIAGVFRARSAAR